MSEKWTQDQLRAIENTAGNMIVSASAGSGKTAVMIERVRRLILDKKVPVTRILMLSFNDAIAEEIKEKMAKVLVEEIKKGKDIEFLQEQIDALGMADITTMHSFCNSLIKEYFDVVGVDPSYSIMDETESAVIINKSINEVFDEYFESNDGNFLLLKDKLTERGEDKLRELVGRIFSFSNALINGDKWLDDAYEKNYAVPLLEAQPVKVYVDRIIGLVNDAYDKLEMAYNSLDTKKFTELAIMIDHLGKYLHEENILKYKTMLDSKPEFSEHRPTKGTREHELYYNAKYAYKGVLEFIQKLFPVSYELMASDHARDAVVVSKLFEVVKRFKACYVREKKEVNKLDFNDLEHYAVEILSHDDIRDDIREKYDYVCVDEYQDTNEVQDTLLRAVSRGDNLFMVGDPKQSIYKFRFTEPELFVDKWQKYGKSETDNAVQLDRNFRSSPLILKYINNVFDVLMKRPTAGKISEAYSNLRNGLEFEDKIDSPFEVMLYDVSRSHKEVVAKPSLYRVSEDIGEPDEKKSAAIEAEYLASVINKLVKEQLYDAKLGAYRDIHYDDMAILASSRSDAVKKTLEILETEYNIPIDSSNLKKKDESQEVKILIDFLRTIDNPRQDIPLYTTMKMFFGFSEEDFIEIKRCGGKADFFHDIIFGDKSFAENICNKIEVFRRELDEYRLMSTFMNVHDFLIHVMECTSFRDKIVMSDNSEGVLDNINKFIVSLKEKKYANTIQDFIYAYENYNITNDVESVSQNVKSAIHTSTIHKSKGLEYPIVFIIGAGNPFISRKTTGSYYMMDKKYGFAMRTYDEKNKTTYSNWLIQALIDKEVSEETEEKMRLLYVAMTRAKNALYIVGQISKDTQNDIDTTHKFTDWLHAIGENNPTFAEHIIRKSFGNEDEDDETKIVLNKEKEPSVFDFEEYSQGDVDKYKSVFEYKYPHEDATKLAQKYTVTSINHEEREHEEYVEELYETEKTSIGSIYHKFMEHVNYEADTAEAIQCEMDRMIASKILTSDEISNISIDDVLKCLNSDIIKKAKCNRHEREKKFMMNLPLSTLKEGASDEKVIVQGIADLIIYGEENILVDFKKSSLPANMLRDNYHKQLEIYKFALEHSMNIKIDKMYLYVIGQDKTIEIA